MTFRVDHALELTLCVAAAAQYLQIIRITRRKAEWRSVRSLDINRQVNHAAIGIGSMRALAPNFRIGGIKGIRGRVRGSVTSSADTRIYSKSGAGGRGGGGGLPKLFT